MKLWIDCEFNEYRGDLISLALVDEDGKEFYQSVGCFDPKPWVAKNVMPIINIEPVTIDLLQVRLEKFLAKYDSVHIISDFPTDVAYFCNALLTGPGTRLDTPPLTMEVVRVDGKSDLPHNALADAHGLRKAMIASK